MTPSELKRRYKHLRPDGHFFDRDTMRAWGDTMQNYGVRDAGDCWELYRKRPVKEGRDASTFFSKHTMQIDYIRIDAHIIALQQHYAAQQGAA